MGLGKFFKGLVDDKTCGENIIEAVVKIYENHAKHMPNEEPHQLLANSWLARMMVHGVNQNDPASQELSFSQTLLFACLPYPKCARALGLYILFKERPDIIAKCSDFHDEYEEYMTPIMEAEENGTLMDLYVLHNPQLATQNL